MAKFVKLNLHNIPGKGDDIQWRLVIDNLEDLNRYHSLDATLNMEAFMAMEREPNGGPIKLSHTGAQPTRQIALQTYIHSKVMTTPVGQKVYPIIEVAQLTDKKYLGMFKYVSQYGAIAINPAGGYCDLSSFIKTWNADILEWVEKDDFGFPVDDAILEADTIILENSHPDYKTYGEWQAAKKVPNAGVIKTIYHLREVDRTYVFQSLKGCKNVVIESEIMDAEQLNGFFKMFLNLPRKNVYLFVREENRAKITDHPDYTQATTLHNIQFMD